MEVCMKTSSTSRVCAVGAKRNSKSPLSSRSKGGANFKVLAPSVALPVRVLTVGKNRSPGVQMVVQEYMEKLRRYCIVEDVQIRSNPMKTSDVRVQIEGEDTKVMQRITPNDWVVLLDENGKDITSEQLANLIGESGSTGSSAVVFCIGGPYGHGQQLRKRADVTIRLSSMSMDNSQGAKVPSSIGLIQLFCCW